MEKFNYAALGARIRRYRRALELTQEKLSGMAGISTSFLGLIERGSRKASLETLLNLSNALQVGIADLFASEFKPVGSENHYRQVVEEIASIIQRSTKLLSEAKPQGGSAACDIS